MDAVIDRPHIVAVPIPLGDFSHSCEWCKRVVPLEYARLVDAAEKTLVECLCPRCRGAALGGAIDKWRAEMRAAVREIAR